MVMRERRVHDDRDIAIVGYAGRLPGAADVEGLWTLLRDNRSAIGWVAPDRFPAGPFYHPAPEQSGRSYTFAAGLIEDVWAFDAQAFGMSPREAEQVDPQQRHLLEVTHDALAHAGVRPSSLAGSETGVYVGASSVDHGARFLADPSAADVHMMTGNTLSILSNRLSYTLDLHGPSFTVDTACSSSMVALCLAADAIRNGTVETAIVGSVNLLLSPLSFVGFSRASMLSPTGRCRPFDEAADGYVRAEGAIVLVLRSVAGARRQRNRIHATLAAWGVGQDGRTNGLSLPSPDSQRRLLRRVYSEFGIDPGELAFVEAHGTGTKAGDPIEADALGKALAQQRAQPLPIGSVKSNIGHLEPASGLAGVLKAILALNRGALPATLHQAQPNPDIPFDALNLRVVAHNWPLPDRRGPLLAGINSFGFGGTNAHVVIQGEDRTVSVAGRRSETAPPPLVLSAHTADALGSVAAGTLKAWPSDRRLVNELIRAAAHQRDMLPHRAIVRAQSNAQIRNALEAMARGETTAAVATGQAIGQRLPIAYVFSGNGSQWAGMGRAAWRASPRFRAALEDIDAQLARRQQWSVVELLFADDVARRLRRATWAQPALLALQMATVRCLEDLGVVPAAAVGHSVGEIAAAWCAGALGAEQAFDVVIARSRHQEAAHGSGAMAALMVGERDARRLLAGADTPGLAIAAVNSRRSVTVSGPADEIELLLGLATEKRIGARRLDLDYPFHSSLVEPVRAPLLRELDGLTPLAGRTTFVSSVTGTLAEPAALGAEHWWRNVREPVQFADAIGCLLDQGLRVFAEIGPRPVLASYVRDMLREADLRGAVVATAAETQDETGDDPLEQAAARLVLAGGDVDPVRFFGPPPVMAVPLPAYPWRRTQFRIRPTAEAASLFAAPAHPLLGSPPRAGCTEWFATIDPALFPWLADHKVAGVAVFPAAGYVEVLLAAAREIHPEGALELAELDIVRPLAFDGTASFETNVRLAAETGIVEFLSRPRGTEAEWALNARAIVARAPVGERPASTSAPSHASASTPSHASTSAPAHASASAPSHAATSAPSHAPTNAPSHASTSAPSRGVVVPKATVYEVSRRLGFDYGPAFQRVRHVTFPERKRGIAVLEATDDLGIAGRVIDLTALDAAFHALFAAEEAGVADVPMKQMLPVRFGRVRAFALGRAVTRIVARTLRQSPSSILVDIELLDGDGTVVLAADDVRLVEAPVKPAPSLRAISYHIATWALHRAGRPSLVAVPGTAPEESPGASSEAPASLSSRTQRATFEAAPEIPREARDDSDTGAPVSSQAPPPDAEGPAPGAVEGPALSVVEGLAPGAAEGPTLSTVEGPALSVVEGLAEALLLIEAGCLRAAWDAFRTRPTVVEPPPLDPDEAANETDESWAPCLRSALFWHLVTRNLVREQDGVPRVTESCTLPETGSVVRSLLARHPTMAAEAATLARLGEIVDRLAAADTAVENDLLSPHFRQLGVASAQIALLRRAVLADIAGIIRARPRGRLLRVLLIGAEHAVQMDDALARAPGLEVVVTDLDPWQLDQARAALGDGSPSIRCVAWSELEAWPAGTFDAAGAVDALSEIAALRGGLARLARLLRPQAPIVAGEPAPGVFWDIVRGVRARWWARSASAAFPIGALLTAREWADELEAACFTGVCASPAFGQAGIGVLMQARAGAAEDHVPAASRATFAWAGDDTALKDRLGAGTITPETPHGAPATDLVFVVAAYAPASAHARDPASAREPDDSGAPASPSSIAREATRAFAYGRAFHSPPQPCWGGAPVIGGGGVMGPSPVAHDPSSAFAVASRALVAVGPFGFAQGRRRHLPSKAGEENEIAPICECPGEATEHSQVTDASAPASPSSRAERRTFEATAEAPRSTRDDGSVDTTGEPAASRLLGDRLLQLAELCRSAVAARLWLVVDYGAQAAGAGDPLDEPLWRSLTAAMRVAQNEYPALEIRCLGFDGAASLDPAAQELVAPTDEREVFYRAGERFVFRLDRGLAAEAPSPAEPDPAERRRLGRAGTARGTLAWRSEPRAAPGPGEVEIEVAATGLNFRDVMWTLGFLPEEALEGGYAGTALGMECAGTVSALGPDVTSFTIGDRVVAFVSGGFASHVTAPAFAVAAVPPDLGIEAAATLPVAFLTAYYALVHLGNLAPGETVLVHGGAGAVGLAALQIARLRGARVIATAGSEEKRALLRTLGAEHVPSSRTLAFADEVSACTGGQGVDVVLNSLAGEAMVRSIDCLKPFGRFIELGKRDLYANTHVGLRPFRRNLAYHAVDLDQLMVGHRDLMQRLFGELLGHFITGNLRPLPHRVFEGERIADAFRLMQKSGHIGKIVVTPARRASAEPSPASRFPVDGEGMHVIVGGTSGFGLATAEWLFGRGARHLALAGRTGVPSAAAAARIDQLRRAGAAVSVAALDVTDAHAMRRLLLRLAVERPVKGLVHAAMVLDDRLIETLDQDALDKVLPPKIEGAANLVEAARDLALDYLLLYSSATTLLGNPGQLNYVAANGFVEGLACQARRRGVPALAVAWGGIADAGYLSRNIAKVASLRKRFAASLVDARTALDALDGAVDGAGRPIAGCVAIARIDWSAPRRELAVVRAPMFAGVVPAAGARAPGESAAIVEKLRTMSPDQAAAALLDLVVDEIAHVLRLPSLEVDRHRALAEIGMDSLMMLELRTAVEESLQVELPLMSLANGTTPADVARRIAGLIAGGGARDAMPAPLAALSTSHVAAQASTLGAVERQAAAHAVLEKSRSLEGPL